MLGSFEHDQTAERTGHGDPVLRHEAVAQDTAGHAPKDLDLRAALDAHLDPYLGSCDLVWQEMVSDLVHIDVCMWRPTDDRPFYTFLTQGMSDLPMTVPSEMAGEVTPHAELLICLPADWPVPEGIQDLALWEDEATYFPIRWLTRLARLPHEHRTWLALGHTVPNGDPAEPFGEGTGLCSWMLLPPMTLPKEAWSLPLSDGRSVDLFGLVGLTRAELDRKLNAGVESLFTGFDRAGVNEVLRTGRPSTV
jgi:hypothetical protein